MKRVLGLAAALSMISTITYAGVTVRQVKFELQGEPVVVVTFTETGHTSVDDKGVTGTYTYDPATNKLCNTTAAGTRCGLLGVPLNAVGDKTTIVDAADPAKTGTVTLIAAH